MNLSISLQTNSEVKKKLFKLKPQRRDGLVLNVHHSKANAKVRFFHCCFHEDGHTIASADNEGTIYIVDFFFCKFWRLPKLDSCTFIKFSSFNDNQILSARNTGDINVIDFDNGQVSGILKGHKLPVNIISFAQKIYCLSASQYEAIIWDLQQNVKLQVLSLNKNSQLKCVAFMPCSNNILACFKDDLIQIWNHGKLESIKQFLPETWNNFSVKTVAFSRNGQVMVVAGYVPSLAIFLLDKWKLAKLVSLPEYILTIKHVEFIVQPFDGGSNKILAILSGHGILYFYDIERNIILSELKPDTEIKKMECCPNGTYIACVMRNGEVELYNLNRYVQPPDDVKVEKAKKIGSKIKCKEKISVIKNEIKDVLDVDKLKSILKEFNEYPEAHRLKIWERLLRLPDNVRQYNAVINHTTVVSFKSLYAQYPLRSGTSIKCLKKFLNNVVTWCPFFAHVEYLPMFAFPFVKVFQNRPIACFEAVCTIMLNWCQHWFEYYPLAPVNVLAMIENVLMEHDPELLHYLSSCDIASNLYAWPLLETAFSEVLTAKEWLLFWDHVLTNEPSFLLCAVVSYSIVHRDVLFSLKTVSNFDFFFHNQNPNNTKRFLQKTYYILNSTSDKMHPRQYLEEFKSLEMGNYPLFVEYPKNTVDLQTEHTKLVNNELADIETYEAQLLEQAKRKWEACDCEKKLEEERRQKEMKAVCLDRIKTDSEKVKTKHEELRRIKDLLEEEENVIFSNALNKLAAGDQAFPSPCNRCFSHLQDEYVKRYTKLLKYKYRIEKCEEVEKYRKYKQKLDDEIEKVKKSLISPDKLKKLNLATNILAVENLIKDVERELQADPETPINAREHSKVVRLEKDVKQLGKDVTKFLDKTHKNPLKSSPKTEAMSQKEDKSSSEGYQKTVRFNRKT